MKIKNRFWCNRYAYIKMLLIMEDIGNVSSYWRLWNLLRKKLEKQDGSLVKKNMISLVVKNEISYEIWFIGSKEWGKKNLFETNCIFQNEFLIRNDELFNWKSLTFDLLCEIKKEKSNLKPSYFSFLNRDWKHKKLLYFRMIKTPSGFKLKVKKQRRYLSLQTREEKK